MFEISAVKSTVPRQQPVGLEQGMRADQEICDDTRPGPTALAIGLPGPAGLERSFGAKGAELDSELSEHLAYNLGGREEPNDLRPDNVTSHNATLGNRRFQGFTGIPAKSGVADDKIEDDAAIDGGDHVEMLLRAVRL